MKKVQEGTQQKKKKVEEAGILSDRVWWGQGYTGEGGKGKRGKKGVEGEKRGGKFRGTTSKGTWE